MVEFVRKPATNALEDVQAGRRQSHCWQTKGRPRVGAGGGSARAPRNGAAARLLDRSGANQHPEVPPRARCGIACHAAFLAEGAKQTELIGFRAKMDPWSVPLLESWCGPLVSTSTVHIVHNAGVLLSSADIQTYRALSEVATASHSRAIASCRDERAKGDESLLNLTTLG